MKTTQLRLGVIGMGPANMASTLTLLGGESDLRYTITAICGLPEEVVRRCAADFQVPFWTTDYRQLVGRDDVDVVAVYSPDALHAEHCLAALEHGKHVVCTKPMVTRLEDAQRLVQAVRQRSVKFLVGGTVCFDRQFLHARQYLDSGALGELIALESHYVHDMRPVFDATPWRLSMPQDLMFGGCIHAIDGLRSLGGEVRRVHGLARRSGVTSAYPQEDDFFVNVEFASGVMGRSACLCGVVRPPVPMYQLGIYGTRGSVQAEWSDNETGVVRVVLDCGEGHESVATHFDAERDRSAYGHGATVIRYMRHFQKCLENDSEPSPGVLDGARSVAVGAAAWESIRTGNVVEVCNEF